MLDQVENILSRLRGILAALLLALAPLAGTAQNNSLLIQTLPGGAYRIWHAQGPSILSDDDVMLLTTLAEPGGSKAVSTGLGAARAQRTEQGVVIELLDAPSDKALLVDYDACGHFNIWHAEGPGTITEEQATDLVLAAIPGGSKRLTLDGQRVARSFLTNIGAMVVIWRPAEAAR